MIELTIALPLFRAKRIAWLALESLCRQKNSNGPEWELIIAEEINQKLSPFGYSNILTYQKRLEEVKCKKIEYIPLNEWIPLARKWRLMGQKTSKSSLGFLLQAADCYSQPWRIIQTYKLFKEQNADWVQNPMGVFYNMLSGTTALFYKSSNIYRPALNIAIKTGFVRQLPLSSKRRNVDGWLFRSCTQLKKKKLNIQWIKGNSWKYGIDTHGLNTISRSRKNMMAKYKPPFRKSSILINDFIPADIMKRLRRFKTT